MHLLSIIVHINKRRGKLTPLRKTTPQSFDAGIQVAKVNQQGQLHMSLALGCVAYTSWQPLHDSDPFPYGSPDNHDVSYKMYHDVSMYPKKMLMLTCDG